MDKSSQPSRRTRRAKIVALIFAASAGHSRSRVFSSKYRTATKEVCRVLLRCYYTPPGPHGSKILGKLDCPETQMAPCREPPGSGYLSNSYHGSLCHVVASKIILCPLSRLDLRLPHEGQGCSRNAAEIWQCSCPSSPVAVSGFQIHKTKRDASFIKTWL